MNIHEFWKAVLVQDENEMEWLKEQKKWVIYW